MYLLQRKGSNKVTIMQEKTRKSGRFGDFLLNFFVANNYFYLLCADFLYNGVPQYLDSQ